MSKIMSKIYKIKYNLVINIKFIPVQQVITTTSVTA